MVGGKVVATLFIGNNHAVGHMAHKTVGQAIVVHTKLHIVALQLKGERVVLVAHGGTAVEGRTNGGIGFLSAHLGTLSVMSPCTLACYMHGNGRRSQHLLMQRAEGESGGGTCRDNATQATIGRGQSIIGSRGAEGHSQHKGGKQCAVHRRCTFHHE